MNVAIPLFGTRVSPRFDCAQSVLIIEVSEGQYGNRREIDFSDAAPHERINRLLVLGTDTVVCGGIDRWSAQSLQSSGVQIFAFNTGEVEDALARLLEGSLPSVNPIEEMTPGDDGDFFGPGRGQCMGRGPGRGLGGRGGGGNASQSFGKGRRGRGGFGGRGRQGGGMQ